MLLTLILSTVLATADGRAVTGTVAELSGEPVRGALVLLRTTLPTGATTRRATTDDAGRFRISGVVVGAHTLRVNAVGFLRPDPISFALLESDRSREVRIIVERGMPRTVRAFDAAGQPLAGARVICASDGIVRALSEADAKGRAVLPTPAGSATVYVIANDGAFGIRRIAPAEKDVRVDVPAAAGALEVATLTTDGAPLPHVGLLVRYNGELLPKETLRFRTGEDGRARLAAIPRGTYELWPYRSEDEADALMVSVSTATAPATLNVLTGENRVTIRFRRR
ncbi:MAG TPA: carboxypeptidase-like regulatory domain-containing protein [Thermoanaerobaculia bacterium]|jgi:hypothetical protein|nr:carboxypeptidase-like regulatory domain-containing protein [Thermoanaerobaculia bacterium]